MLKRVRQNRTELVNDESLRSSSHSLSLGVTQRGLSPTLVDWIEKAQVNWRRRSRRRQYRSPRWNQSTDRSPELTLWEPKKTSLWALQSQQQLREMIKRICNSIRESRCLQSTKRRKRMGKMPITTSKLASPNKPLIWLLLASKFYPNQLQPPPYLSPSPEEDGDRGPI